jgi:hypothetical protein
MGDDTPRRFRDIERPERFILKAPTVDGGWIDHGLYAADLFDRLEDGTYVCAGHGGSPLFLRCLDQRGVEIEVADGAGYRFIYLLVAHGADDGPDQHPRGVRD